MVNKMLLCTCVFEFFLGMQVQHHNYVCNLIKLETIICESTSFINIPSSSVAKNTCVKRSYQNTHDCIPFHCHTSHDKIKFGNKHLVFEDALK